MRWKGGEQSDNVEDRRGAGGMGGGLFGGRSIGMGTLLIAVVAGLWFGTQAVRAGTLDHTMLAVLTLVPLALHEVFNDFTKAAQTWTRARVALDRVREVLSTNAVGSGDLPASDPVAVPRLAVRDLTIGWPGAAPLASVGHSYPSSTVSPACANAFCRLFQKMARLAE